MCHTVGRVPWCLRSLKLMLVKVGLLSAGYRLSWEYLLSWNTLRVARRFCNYKQGWLDKIASDRSFNQFPPQWNTLTFPSCKRVWMATVITKQGWISSIWNKQQSMWKIRPSFHDQEGGKKKKNQCSYLPSQLHLASWNSQFQRDCWKLLISLPMEKKACWLGGSHKPKKQM